ncbi:class I SAM-dependent methyltransferase [Litorivicinus sp.]|nr:class I SAM-dependent methyltransferase [Litorivicinus sp.]MDC1239969.1 class I SAM-dependent methyltransferase [Litorivicinus sp.]
MNCVDLLEAKKVYECGGNVTAYLRKKFNETQNTSEIIEIAYDLQAGNYIDRANFKRDEIKLYVNEMAIILDEHVSSEESLLDLGTGELTTLTLVLNDMLTVPKEVLAFDISWSRLIKGKGFYEENIRQKTMNLSTFAADMKEIPLHANCIDVVTSYHALEPNGENLGELLKELFRITKKKLILFEPSYELNSAEGQELMDKHGYIKGIQSVVEKLGGRVIDIALLKNHEKLNPTACYIIEPTFNNDPELTKDRPIFCVPGTNFVLESNNGFYDSKETGLVFPVLQDVPIFKSQFGILATAKF